MNRDYPTTEDFRLAIIEWLKRNSQASEFSLKDKACYRLQYIPGIPAYEAIEYFNQTFNMVFCDLLENESIIPTGGKDMFGRPWYQLNPNKSQ